MSTGNDKKNSVSTEIGLALIAILTQVLDIFPDSIKIVIWLVIVAVLVPSYIWLALSAHWGRVLLSVVIFLAAITTIIILEVDLGPHGYPPPHDPSATFPTNSAPSGQYPVNTPPTGATIPSSSTPPFDFARSAIGIIFASINSNSGAHLDRVQFNKPDTIEGITPSVCRPEDSLEPSVSPDGSRLAVVCNEDILIIDLQSLNDPQSRHTLVHLTNTSQRREFDPSWSPDGKAIAFAATNDDEDTSDIYYRILSTDTDDTEQQVTTHAANDEHPTWSPDGTHIAFVSDRDGNKDIYVCSKDCNGSPTNLTNSSGTSNLYPHWSSQGKLVFSSDRDGVGTDIYVLDIESKEHHLQRLTYDTDTVNNYNPCWSPDGNWIAYERYLRQNGSTSAIYIIEYQDETNGEKPKPIMLSGTSSHARAPDWQPYSMTTMHSYE